MGSGWSARTFGLRLRYKDLAGVTQTLQSTPSAEMITNIPANVIEQRTGI